MLKYICELKYFYVTKSVIGVSLTLLMNIIVYEQMQNKISISISLNQGFPKWFSRRRHKRKLILGDREV